MPYTDDTNQEEIKIDTDSQSTMFDEAPNEVHIDHEESHDEDRTVARSTKIKVVSAIAIIAAAAYLAYWVQEPAQIQGDVLAADNLVAQEGDAMIAEEDIVDIDVSIFGFEPAQLEVEIGTTVRWTNTSSTDQTIIGDGTDGTSFTSPTLESGEDYTYTFETDAEYEYYSTYNPAFKGTITAGLGDIEAAGVLEETVEEVAPEADAPVEAAPVETEPVPVAPAPVEEAPVEDLPVDDLTPETDAVEASATDVEPVDTAPAVSAPVADLGEAEVVAELSPAAEEVADSEPVGTMEEAMADTEELQEAAMEDLDELSETGPAEMIYLLAFGAILYFNRRKLGLVKEE